MNKMETFKNALKAVLEQIPTDDQVKAAYAKFIRLRNWDIHHPVYKEKAIYEYKDKRSLFEKLFNKSKYRPQNYQGREVINKPSEHSFEGYLKFLLEYMSLRKQNITKENE